MKHEPETFCSGFPMNPQVVQIIIVFESDPSLVL